MKKMLNKKTVGILTAVIMIFGMMTLSVSAKNSYTVGTTGASLKPVKEILFYEDFNGMTSGTSIVNGDWLGNNQLVVSNTNATVSVAGDDSNKYVSYQGSSTSTEFRLHANGTPLEGILSSGTYVTEFKWMQPVEYSVTSLFSIKDNAGKYGSYIRINASGNTNPAFLAYCNGSSTYNTMTTAQDSSENVNRARASVIAGVWYTAKIVTDLDSKTYSVYINGREMVKNAQFRDYSSWNGAVRFPFCVQTGTANVETYFDDIIIYRDYTDRINYTAEDFSGYTEDRDWSEWQNPDFANSRNLVCTTSGYSNDAFADYKPAAVDKFDTWLEGMDYRPTKKNTNGKINATTGKLEMSASSEFVLGNSYQALTRTSEGMAVAFTFSADNPTENHGSIFVSQEYAAKNFGIRIVLNENKFYAYDDTNKPRIIMENVEADTDYHFVIWIHKNTANNYADKATIYINGKCVANDVPYIQDTATAPTDIGRPFSVAIGNAITGKCYYDDIAFWLDKRENVMRDGMIDIQDSVIDEIADGNTSVTFPTSATAGYSLSWTSSDTSVINPATGAVNYGAEEKMVTLTATVTDTGNEYSVTREIDVLVPAKITLTTSWNGTAATCSASVNGGGNDYNGATLIVAVYNESGTLVGIKLGEITGNSGLVSYTPASIPVGTYTVRGYAWENLTSIKPLCVPIEEGFTISE